ncbi:MAG TPA: serine hydrolase [Chitinophagales bacterium]|nr:serine hydrolase [Chitinophagales bacterium]HRK27052.1 serine hydrolase [Chitinophagales bacterium]
MLRILFTLCVLWGSIHITKAQPFNPILAAKLQNTIDSIRNENNVKGISACIIHPDIGTWKGVTGISHLGNPITASMEFGIASNTKLFTGVLLLKLSENQIVNLDDSLHAYLPPFNNINPNITIRQLLNHTSGLYDVTSVPGYPDSILTNPNRIFTPIELISWAGPPLFAAGTDWNYCNTNYLLAGMIAESATGQSFGKLLRDSILAPLQLDSTFLDVYDTILYTVAHPWQAGVNNISIPRKSLNSAAWAAGAMYSTSGEMAQWYRALMNGQVLNSNSFNEMTTFVGSGSYGIGLSEATVLGRTVWQHGGLIWGGYNSSMMYDTESGIIICVLINQLPAQAFQVATQLLSTILNSNCNNDIVITGSSIVCLNGAQMYSVPPVTGATYVWTVSGGTIISGQGTNSIQVIWNNGITGVVSIQQTNP